MKTGIAWKVAVGASVVALGVWGGGCTSAAVRTTYGLGLADVRHGASNHGDRYCVVQIRETDGGTGEERNSPALARKVQAQLETGFPEWFSSGADTVPVIVVSQSSPPRVIYDGACFSSVLTGLVSLFTLGTLPYHSPRHKMDFQTRLLEADGGETSPAAYRATTLHVSALPSMLDAFWPERAGWKRIDERNYPAGFDIDDSRREEALCASIARLVQNLESDEREAVRNNSEAWYWDAKLGHKRNRRVEVARAAPIRGGGNESTDLSLPATHPAIVAQTWDGTTRKGMLRCDVARCNDRNAALRWVSDEYLPEYCRTLGVVVSADDPSSAPAADIRIERFGTLEDGTVQIEFRILN